MLKAYILSLTLFILINYVNAEKIDGPANIRIEPNGLTILSLNDNAQVECSILENNWYRVGISLKITKQQFEQNSTFNIGDSLFNWEDEFVGKVVNKIPFECTNKWNSGGAPGNPIRFGIEIYATTFKSNIKLESIPEPALKAIIIKKGTDLNENDLLNYISYFNFFQHGILKNIDESYNEYMIYESTMDDPSPMDRIRLIFQNTVLIAIVHTRNLSDTFDSYELVRGRRVTIMKKMDTISLNSFIELNKESYRGVD